MATTRLEGDQMCMRIYIGEKDKYKGKPLYKAILDYLKESDIAGSTVYRAIAGYGPNSYFRTVNLLSLSVDLPIVVEVVDDPVKIEKVLLGLDKMIPAGMITLQNVHVLTYKKR